MTKMFISYVLGTGYWSSIHIIAATIRFTGIVTYMDKVSDDYETMIVTRKNNKNVAMISEESYNNMMGNLHVMGYKTNYDWLMESKTQLKKGNVF